MPRISNHLEIHHLYSVVQRKKDFPDVDWGFLLHSARNCAIAFDTIHSRGHVVGDVNQKNVLISKKGTVALVDCDSFQVRAGSRVFRCGVGVPEYTPPELHGRRFSDLDRDPNHDLFGLAVMIFHLLMMGRHPFAGVPNANVDITIEKAIQDGLYAYSHGASRLKPPPHAPPLAMLDLDTRNLFERAFTSKKRPAASEWRHTLDAAMSRLKRCNNDPKHAYLSGDGCPWCRLIAGARLMFFTPSHQGNRKSLGIDDLRSLINRLTDIELVLPAYARPLPALPIKHCVPPALLHVRKPVLLPYPAAPQPLNRPTLLPEPHPPILTARPSLRSLPPPPKFPPAPLLIPYPPPPALLPRPTLASLPLPAVHPPLPTVARLDPFLTRLALFATLAGIPISAFAKPVGIIMMVAFGSWWLLLLATYPIRRQHLLKALRVEHSLECERLYNDHRANCIPVETSNAEIMKAWAAANSSIVSDHAHQRELVDRKNRPSVIAWENAKAAIKAEYDRNVSEVNQENQRRLLDWREENNQRLARHEHAKKIVRDENDRLLRTWESLVSARLAEHRRECERIDAINSQTVTAWKAANVPWIAEQSRLREASASAEAELIRLEDSLRTNRAALAQAFRIRKAAADEIVRSFQGVRQEYERELIASEADSKRQQLDEFLDKSLIRKAVLRGITGGRILALESFGIETAKDVALLERQKVPGIGPVSIKRLFDWRNGLKLSFQPKSGLTAAEMSRIEGRYAPALLPLKQAVEIAIGDLERMVVGHRSDEESRIRSIQAAVQGLAVAEASLRAMDVS